MDRIRGFFSNWYVLRFIRAIRVGVLGGSLYFTGYQAGMAYYIHDPKAVEEFLLQQTIRQSGASTVLPKDTETQIRLNKMADRVIKAAIDFCEDEIRQLEIKKRTDKLLLQEKLKTQDSKSASHIKTPALKDSIESKVESKATELDREEEVEDENVAGLHEALKKLHGKWEYLIIDSPTPNAFVSPILPNKIVVHEGLFELFKITDDELGLVLSHEVSHVIHDHSMSRSNVQMILYVLQLVALSFVDPLGISFIFYDVIVSQVSNLITASYTREDEYEADETGIKIAAKACVNTVAAAGIFKKFNDFEESMGRHASWFDSHPMSIDRFNILTQLSTENNPTKYSHCTKENADYWTFFFLRSRNDHVKAHPASTPNPGKK